jgi:D-glycerate 3-kinase
MIESQALLQRARASLDALIPRLGIERPAATELLQSLCVPLAQAIAARLPAARGCGIIGLAGAQGTGKSTLAALTCVLLEAGLQLRTCVVSLDDYYLPQATRRALARDVHPLLATRGVPGTHAVAALHEALRRLRGAGRDERVELFQFDKAHDERAAESRQVVGPFDVVLFEGWCVGARPQPERDLLEPLGALERAEDPDATFRSFVNAQLALPYAQLWAELDMLVYLAVPDFAVVQQLRREQEQKLRASARSDARRVMNDVELRRFVEHFERITRHMLRTTAAHADLVVELDADRAVRAIVTSSAGSRGRA